MSVSAQGGISPVVVNSGNTAPLASESYNPVGSSAFAPSGGFGVAGASSVIAPVLTAVNSSITYTSTQESPQAIDALKTTVGTALNTMSTDSLASITASRDIAKKALDTSLQALQSPLQQAAKGIVVPLLIAIVVIAGVYYWRKNS